MVVIRVLVNIFIIFSKENTQNCVFGGKLVFFDKIGNANEKKKKRKFILPGIYNFHPFQIRKPICKYQQLAITSTLKCVN